MVGYFRNEAKRRREKSSFLENEIRNLEQSLNNKELKSKLKNFKDDLNDMYEDINNKNNHSANFYWYANFVR